METRCGQVKGWRLSVGNPLRSRRHSTPEAVGSNEARGERRAEGIKRRGERIGEGKGCRAAVVGIKRRQG